MNFTRLAVDVRRVAGFAVALSTFVLVWPGAGRASDLAFPYDRELLLDAAPMRPAKRIPSLTIAADGSATIDLWCRSVSGRAELGEKSIAIVPDALAETPPPTMGEGQCTPARMRADEDMLAALSQVTAWRREGSAIVLAGVKPLRFRPASN